MLKLDGSVWAAGMNIYGQVGDILERTPITKFIEVFPGVSKAVAAGGGHSMVLKHDGTVWSAGRNKFGQLGDGTYVDRSVFVPVISGDHAKGLAVSSKHSLMVKEDGSVWSTGSNVFGQLGDEWPMTHTSKFKEVMCCDANAVAAGNEHSMVLKDDSTVWTAGWNHHGQLGVDIDPENPFGNALNKFVRVVSSGATAIAAGGYHSLVLKADGTVWGAGANNYGQLGDGSMISSNKMHMVSSPVMQKATGGAVAIAAGMRHSIVLGRDGSVWTAGSNAHGQLGDGTRLTRHIFVQVVSSGAQAVAAGGSHTMMIDQDDSVWATGSNEYGQLGYGPRIVKDTFFRVVLANDGMWCMEPWARSAFSVEQARVLFSSLMLVCGDGGKEGSICHPLAMFKIRVVSCVSLLPACLPACMYACTCAGLLFDTVVYSSIAKETMRKSRTRKDAGFLRVQMHACDASNSAHL